ncbi:MAG: hypothetical protein K9G42_11870 [Pedobacter sp.]|nr:hypothetical protein [Pedobacter sp.]
MYFKNQVFLLILILFFVQLSVAQNNTNSPYTRFGLGELIDAYSGEQKSLGGVGFGSRNSGSINAMNPASYSAVDSMTFMFDMGFGGLMSRFTVPTGSNTKYNANLEYVTLQFPVNKWMGISAGMLPYSFTGYQFYRQDSILMPGYKSDTYAYYNETYAGTGGISQVYAGLGMKFLDHVSVGLNAYYMFGDVINNRSLLYSTTDFKDATQVNSVRVSNFRFRYGLQLFNTFAKKHDVTLGLIYENKAPLNGIFEQRHYAVPADTIVYDDAFDLSNTLGIGLYYTYDNKISLGLDYQYQAWEKARYYGAVDSLNNRSKLSVGLQYIPDPRGKKYLERVRYRAGFNMSDPYYKIPGVSNVKNIGISFGVGLPLRTGNTMLNATIEYGKSGESSVIREDYLKFTFNAVFNESWFFKRKL